MQYLTNIYQAVVALAVVWDVPRPIYDQDLPSWTASRPLPSERTSSFLEVQLAISIFPSQPLI